ncbi:phosphate acetyltransferase [Caballeronia choica]|uniref:Phosphate acetyltransferase n=1 Tax=Caballeronia choica TaxID=326476 RepID=A0A158EZK2_9BURK|nr:phosphate acetyltransferase [Caballeronia choica]
MEARHARYQRLIDLCKTIAPTPTAVVRPCDPMSLEGASIVPILVGPHERIQAVAASRGIDRPDPACVACGRGAGRRSPPREREDNGVTPWPM